METEYKFLIRKLENDKKSLMEKLMEYKSIGKTAVWCQTCRYKNKEYPDSIKCDICEDHKEYLPSNETIELLYANFIKIRDENAKLKTGIISTIQMMNERYFNPCYMNDLQIIEKRLQKILRDAK